VLRIETNSNVHRLSESEVFVASNHLSLSVSEGKFAIAESRKVIYMKMTFHAVCYDLTLYGENLFNY